MLKHVAGDYQKHSDGSTNVKAEHPVSSERTPLCITLFSKHRHFLGRVVSRRNERDQVMAQQRPSGVVN